MAAKRSVSPSGTSAAAATAPSETEEAALEEARPKRALRTLAPRMPPGIHAMIHEQWTFFDPEAERLLGWMRSEKVFHEFAHGRAPFYNHLRGTWAMLAHWGQPQDVCRCGLLHSAYTRDGFYFRHFDLLDPKSREDVRGVVGPAAEQLIYNYCSTDRMWDQGEFFPEALRGKPAEPWMLRFGEPLPKGGQDFPCRRDPQIFEHLSAEEIAKYFVVFVADIAEQLSSTNSYIDIYHQEQPEVLWPGECAPGVFHHVLSRMLRSARDHLEVVPQIYNNCTEVITIANEVEARQCYWEAMTKANEGGALGLGVPVLQGPKLEKAEQERLYRRAGELNPFIAEPHIMLSQLLYNREAFAEAADEAIHALEILYDWGTCWDKRRSWAQWVGFSRMALLRATRRLQGKPSMPMRKLSEASDPNAVPVTYLKDLIAGFEEVTEKPNLRSRL